VDDGRVIGVWAPGDSEYRYTIKTYIDIQQVTY